MVLEIIAGCLAVIVLCILYSVVSKFATLSLIPVVKSKLDEANFTLNEIKQILLTITQTLSSHDNKIWEFLMERAKTSVLKEGLGKMNSPFVIDEQVLKYFEPLKADLRQFYVEHCQNLGEYEVYREISHHFRDRLQNEICIPLGLENGECVFLATHIAKQNEPDSITLRKNEDVN